MQSKVTVIAAVKSNGSRLLQTEKCGSGIVCIRIWIDNGNLSAYRIAHNHSAGYGNGYRNELFVHAFIQSDLSGSVISGLVHSVFDEVTVAVLQIKGPISEYFKPVLGSLGKGIELRSYYFGRTVGERNLNLLGVIHLLIGHGVESDAAPFNVGNFHETVQKSVCRSHSEVIGRAHGRNRERTA